MGITKVGKHSYGNPRVMGDMNNITIGSFVSIAGNVTFDGGFQHNTKNITTYPFNQKGWGYDHIDTHPLCKGDIIIGNDVWIGENVTIYSGVLIGDGAVIAGNSVVTKNVFSYDVVGGVPAKILKNRLTDNWNKFEMRGTRKICIDKNGNWVNPIQMMVDIAWWNWEDEKIKLAIPYLMDPTPGCIERFIEAYQDGKFN